MGYPLSQTLFTNVYVEAMLVPTPSTISEADFIRDAAKAELRSPMHLVLRAYCLGLLKTCWYVVERVKFENYFEAG
jgi:N-alpha-acetyltransferase 35, NatC auxiliary subunit